VSLPIVDVGFLDSGVGGLAYLDHFLARNSHLSVAYIADTKHFPYGPKTPAELQGILVSVLDQFFAKVDCSLLVLACNTASIVALEHLRKTFPTKAFIGTVPAIKPAVLSSNTKSIGVLGTTRTVKDQYIFQLGRTHGPNCLIHVEPADDLVRLVEQSTAQELHDQNARPTDLVRILEPYITRFRTLKVDQIVLGCTHFLHLHTQFNRLFGNEFTFQDSREGITNRIYSLLNNMEWSRTKEVDLMVAPQRSHYLIITDQSKMSPLLQDRIESRNWEMLPFSIPAMENAKL
jgi:glutamate racemase